MPRTANLPIFIDGGDGRTLQHQIYESIRRAIVDGLVGAGEKLPSTRSLATALGVSRTTTLLALEQLRAEGYVIARRGSGMFIAPKLPAKVAPRAGPVDSPTARPPFSMRGYMLSRLRPPDRRRAGAPACAFRLGTPAIDLFPHGVWTRLARAALRDARPAQRDYSALAGLRELRVAIAELVQSRGTRCDPEQVHVVMGAQRGLDLIAHLLLDPGDDAWIEDPGYPGARGAFVSAGAAIVPVPVDREGLVIAPGESRRARVAYVTPSCQFPLGVPLSYPRRLNLLDWARRARAWIIEDDYDCDLRYDHQPLPCLHALDPDGRVIYVGTFSKTLFPALRLGFLIVPSDLVDGFVTARLATDLHPPVFEQRVLAAFIRDGHYERHLRRMQAAYTERLGALRDALARSGAPLRLRAVQAGMHAVVDVESVSAERVHELAAARGIESMPLSAYYSDPRVAPEALLLGFGAVPAPAIRAGVTKLAEIVETLRRR